MKRSRKQRRRSRAILTFGKSAVRKHQRISGRTGSIHSKQTPKSNGAKA